MHWVMCEGMPMKNISYVLMLGLFGLGNSASPLPMHTAS